MLWSTAQHSCVGSAKSTSQQQMFLFSAAACARRLHTASGTARSPRALVAAREEVR